MSKILTTGEKFEYYEPCVRDYSSQTNQAAILENMIRAEPSSYNVEGPDSGHPTHSRVTSTVRADAVMCDMIRLISEQVVLSARNTLAAKYMNPADSQSNLGIFNNVLHSRSAKIQPLGYNAGKQSEDMVTFGQYIPQAMMIEPMEPMRIEKFFTEIEDIGRYRKFNYRPVGQPWSSHGAGGFFSLKLMEFLENLIEAIGQRRPQEDPEEDTGNRCVQAILTINKQALADINAGYSSNRALETTDTETRKNRKFKSRA